MQLKFDARPHNSANKGFVVYADYNLVGCCLFVGLFTTSTIHDSLWLNKLQNINGSLFIAKYALVSSV